MRGDLHIHSTASDGSLSPRQIIKLAKSRGVDTIAISDHNSVDGIAEASEAGKEYGISVIPAVELSTRFNDESIHILGYFRTKKFNSTDFEQILNLVKTHRAHRLRKVLGGYRKHQTFNKYLSSSEGIYILRAFGAAVVLAHPVRISDKNFLSLLSMPFDGIEAKYCCSNDYYTNFFINLALKRFSFYTGGSDFHTNKVSDHKHSLIGEPYLESTEIQRFLKNSGALILGSSINGKII
jgi:Predicted metal-dependent phosphoesterases (PHP family)